MRESAPDLKPYLVSGVRSESSAIVGQTGCGQEKLILVSLFLKKLRASLPGEFLLGLLRLTVCCFPSQTPKQHSLHGRGGGKMLLSILVFMFSSRGRET